MKVVSSYDGHSSSTSSPSSTTKVTNVSRRTTTKKKVTESSNINTNSNSKSKTSVIKESVQSPYPIWHNVVAGAAAGAGARFFTAPLDLIKIRRQLVSPSSASGARAGIGATLASFTPLGLFHSLKDIVKTEGGLPSLFRGNLAATVRFFLFVGLFGWFVDWLVDWFVDWFVHSAYLEFK
jgi:hypothetical protein